MAGLDLNPEGYRMLQYRHGASAELQNVPESQKWVGIKSVENRKLIALTVRK